MKTSPSCQSTVEESYWKECRIPGSQGSKANVFAYDHRVETAEKVIV